MSALRAAIVGTGDVAEAHVEAIADLPEVDAIAAVDIDEQRLQAFCDQHAIPGRHTSVRTMLKLEHPDLVHICSPPSVHFEHALTCLREGVSVLVEKPPALSLAQLHDLAQAQGEGGPYMATVFQHRFGTGAHRLRKLLDRGVLGRPLLAICHTVWFRNQAYFDVPWRGNWDTEGGGPTMGHGIHQMDLLGAVLGPWTEISAIARQQVRLTATEDMSMAHITFANGAVASVVNSVLSPREETYLRFDFERATVELTHLYGYGEEDWRVTAIPSCEEKVMAAWRDGSAEVRSGHHAQLEAVFSALRCGAPPPVTAIEAKNTMQMVAGVYASAFGHAPVCPEDLRPDSPYFDRMDGGGATWAI